MIWFALASPVHAAEADVRFGLGIPDVAHVQLGVPISDRWDVHARLGTNLGLLTYFGASVGGRWDALVRERGPRRLVLGVGPDVWVGPTSDVVAVIVSASVQLEWTYDLGPVGLIVSSSAGVGPTFDAPADRFRVEPATPLVPLQVGLRFGSRSSTTN